MGRRLVKKDSPGRNINMNIYISCELFNEFVEYLDKNHLTDGSLLVGTLIKLFLKTDTSPKHFRHHERLGDVGMWKRK